jgi:peptidoglycan/LPS O-acetylase OafA/YrhL
MTSIAPSVLPSARFAGLDGLRAIAVVLVVVYHLFPPALSGGFIGVDVFFVISGFLITSLLLRRRTTTGSVALGRFWQRRARRLLPALAVVVAVCSTLAWLVGGDALVRLDAQVLGAATFSYNWVSLAGGGGYFSAAAPELFRNFWSLAVEEQFYVLWPLLFPLFLLIPRAWGRAAAACALALASAAWMGVVVSRGGDLTRAYFGTDTHAFGLLLGVALAFLLAPVLSAAASSRDAATRPRWTQTVRARRVVEVAGVAAVAAIVLLGSLPAAGSAPGFPGTLLAASILTAVAITAGVWPGAGFGRALDVAPLRWIGDRSYGIYLWHWPLLVLATAVLPEATVATVPASVGFGVLALTLAASALSFRYIETPVRRHGFRVSVRALWRRLQGGPRARLRVLGAALAGVLMLAGTGAALAAAPDESSAEAAVEAGRRALAQSRVSPEITPSPRSTAAPDGSVPGEQISAIGDSVMLASAGGLMERLPGIDIDAEVSRPMRAGPRIVEALAADGRLRRCVVIALGTNGAVDPVDLDRIAADLGPDRDLVLVSAYAPRDWIPGVNAELQAFAAARPNVVVADWAGAIASHEDLLAGDRIHPGEAGGRLFAEAVAEAVDHVAAERRERAELFVRLQQARLDADR